MLWVNKCNFNGGGGYFPIKVHILPMPKIWNYFFFVLLHLWTKLSQEIGYNELVVDMRKYCLKSERSAKITRALRQS